MLSPRILAGLAHLDDVGETTAVGVVLEQQTGAGNRALRVPEGQVFLLEALMVQADTTPAGIGGAFVGSPDLTVYGVSIRDSAGDGVGDISFLAFRRWQDTFWTEGSPALGTPNWRDAPPGNVVTWRPTYPFPIPENWEIRNVLGGDWANQCAVYGRFVSKDAARTLGYNVSGSTTETERRYFVKGFAPTASAVENVTGRAGKCIRILDVHVRIQPVTNTTNKVTLRQSDDRVIFSWTNNNPSDLLELKFSPDIFLEPGEGIESIASVASTASIVLSYEYVDADKVPGDHWWAYVEPDLPTPGVTKIGTGSAFPAISTQLTCFYPRRPVPGSGDPVTKTSPTQGFQHIVRGFTFSAQKDNTANPDQTMMCLSSGASAGNIKGSVFGVTSQGNLQISPVITFTAHDMCVYGAIDKLNIACPKDTGALWIDTMTVGPATGVVSAAATPTSTDADIDEWSFTVWGRTIPSRFTSQTNRGA